jgi:hypothetical protein
MRTEVLRIRAEMQISGAQFEADRQNKLAADLDTLRVRHSRIEGRIQHAMRIGNHHGAKVLIREATFLETKINTLKRQLGWMK